MLNETRKVILAVSFALMALMASALSVAAQNSYYKMRMENDSGYPIYQVYFPASGSQNWGSGMFYEGLFQLGVFSTGLHEQRHIRIGVFPECQQILVLPLRRG